MLVTCLAGSSTLATIPLRPRQQARLCPTAAPCTPPPRLLGQGMGAYTLPQQLPYRVIRGCTATRTHILQPCPASCPPCLQRTMQATLRHRFPSRSASSCTPQHCSCTLHLTACVRPEGTGPTVCLALAWLASEHALRMETCRMTLRLCRQRTMQLTPRHSRQGLWGHTCTTWASILQVRIA